MKMANKKVTLSLMVFILAVFIADFFFLSPSIFTADHLINGNDYGLLTEYGRLLNYRDMGFELWRLVTSLFLHAGIPHLLVNLLALFVLGDNLEKIVGGGRFLLIFTLSGVLASLVTIFYTNGAVGASGALYGLTGLYLWLLFSRRITLSSKGRIAELVLVILYLILPNLGSRTAISAHLAGLVTGLLIGILFYRGPKEQTRH